MPFQHMYVADLKLEADKVADFYVTQSMSCTVSKKIAVRSPYFQV